ncbi:MAG: RagB/SusD family nutrient uptake outer membrane protein [Odoribacter sp.]
MKKYILYFMIVPCLLLTSCNKWLEIDPEDRVIEKNLFNSKEGFIVALNGIYIEMSSPDLYGGKMEATVIDVMAQYYTYAMPSVHAYLDYANFDYTQEGVKGSFATIWAKYYNLIINCNAIIEHCDEATGLLGDKYYNVIKGEALALRALFHFDLLRVWGPVYKENKKMECLPYAESSKIEVRPLLPANEVYEKIKADLKAAESYLQKSDPIITEGALFSIGGYDGNDMRYRNLRMNYFAVQALLARVALYCDEKPLALEYALKVIGEVHREGNVMFPFVNRTGGDLEDRMYQTELLFAHYNLKRPDIYKNYFSNSLSNSNVLRVDDDLVEGMYEETDFRYKYQWSKLKNSSDVEQYYFMKYKPVELQNSENKDEIIKKEYRYLVPMIRISEMYYIAAECYDDPEQALFYLNEVRNARALKKLTDASLIPDELEKEYKREFIGEGQLFFYYKRLGKEEIQYGNYSWDAVTMSSDKYVVPLPDAEKNNRISK